MDIRYLGIWLCSKHGKIFHLAVFELDLIETKERNEKLLKFFENKLKLKANGKRRN